MYGVSATDSVEICMMFDGIRSLLQGVVERSASATSSWELDMVPPLK
jgi:hypothetical protein